MRRGQCGLDHHRAAGAAACDQPGPKPVRKCGRRGDHDRHEQLAPGAHVQLGAGGQWRPGGGARGERAAPVAPNTAQSNAAFTPAAAGTYLFDVTATNANGASPATRVAVTVNAAAVTNLAITTAEFRTSKQRLDLSVTAADLTVTSMKLQPYLTETDTTFDPATLGAASLTNTGGGLWTLTVVGAPRPAFNLGGTYVTPCAKKPLIVTSTGGAAGPGTSVPTTLTKIRQ